ncbi:RNA-binding protein [Rhodotorula paludigena]|uniref:RNA-binding protein n=1 Tax=Rhodotorula paludigena TaxID=86838 RepID=UPI00316DDCD0
MSRPQRGFSPEASTAPGSLPREPTPTRPENWVYVGNMPTTIAERYIYDQLTTAGIVVDDVFLSTSHSKPARFAYVAVHDRASIPVACETLEWAPVGNRNLSSKPFVDTRTGQSWPEIANSDWKRRYVGPDKQAQLQLDKRQLGLFLMHVARSATTADVRKFLRRSLRAEQIGTVSMRQLGMNTLAFIDMRDEAACRKAIVDLDGECFCGNAVRVSWQELDKREGLTRVGNRIGRVISQSSASADINFAPLAKNRYNDHRAATGQTDVPPAAHAAAMAHQLTIERDDPADKAPFKAAARSTAPTSSASGHGLSQIQGQSHERSRSSDRTGDQVMLSADEAPIAPVALDEPALRESIDPTMVTAAQHEDDLERLRSLGMTDKDIKAIELVWTPLDQPPAGRTSGEAFARSVTTQVRFGYVSPDDARAALEHNAEAPAFPDDAAMQARYEAFLRAQAGESRDWYTVFFAQLADFNRLSAAFTAKARELVSSAAAGADERNKMEVDESSVKQEE